MNPIPLLSPAGIPYAYVCGTCQHIPTIGRMMCRLTPEMIKETADDYLRQAESCCACYTCKVPLPEDNGYEDRCQACREKQEAEDAPRRKELQEAQAVFDAKAAEALAKSPFPSSAELLCNIMSDISEDYCAGWLCGLEYILWEMLQGGPRHFGMGEVTKEEIAQLRTLHEKCGGWWVWRRDENDLASGEVYVSLEEWQKILEPEFDDELLADALQVVVETGQVSAKCSSCKMSILPEEHEERRCMICGPFAEHQPVYDLPS